MHTDNRKGFYVEQGRTCFSASHVYPKDGTSQQLAFFFLEINTLTAILAIFM